MRIVYSVVYFCAIGDNRTVQELWTVVTVLYYGVPWLIWLAIYMLPLTAAMLRLARIQTRPCMIAQTVTLGLVVISWIASVVVNNLVFWSVSQSEEYTRAEDGPLPRAAVGLSAATATLSLVGVVQATALMVFAMIKAWREPTMNKVRLRRSRCASELKGCTGPQDLDSHNGYILSRTVHSVPRRGTQ